MSLVDLPLLEDLRDPPLKPQPVVEAAGDALFSLLDEHEARLVADGWDGALVACARGLFEEVALAPDFPPFLRFERPWSAAWVGVSGLIRSISAVASSVAGTSARASPDDGARTGDASRASLTASRTRR